MQGADIVSKADRSSLFQAFDGGFVGDRLYVDLKRFAATASAHTPLASVRSLAGKYGISPGAAMLTINRLAEEGWVYKKHGCGCFIAQRQISADVSEEQAIVFAYSRPAVRQSYYADVLQGVIETSAACGYKLQIRVISTGSAPETYRADWRRFLLDIARTDVAGAIVPWVEPLVKKSLKTLRPDLPVLVTQKERRGDGCSTVIQDMFYHGFKAGEYLLGGGVKRLVAVSNNNDFDAGFKEALAATKGLQVNILNFSRRQYPETLVRQLLQLAPEGVAFSDDIAAASFLAQISGVSPAFSGEVKIISHSNKGVDILPRTAARLENDGFEFGRTAVQTLQTLIRGSVPQRMSVEVKPRLILPGELAQADDLLRIKDMVLQ